LVNNFDGQGIGNVNKKGFGNSTKYGLTLILLNQSTISNANAYFAKYQFNSDEFKKQNILSQ
jgi:hypothetical protein